MNKRLAVVVTLLVMLAAIPIWKHNPRMRGASSTPVARADSVQRLEDGVITAYRRLERAYREGDGALWLSLRSREAVAGMTNAQREEFPKRFPADPGLQYVPLAVGASGSRGVVIGRLDGSATNTVKYEAVKFALEEGAWKVDVESMSESPLDPRSLYALLPPADGAFARAGSPWARIPYADPNTKFKEDERVWKMQATQDEAFLYIRFEAKTPLPAPGMEVHADDRLPGTPVNSGAPAPPPVMTITISEVAGGQTAKGHEFSFQVGDVIKTRSTFDKHGKANSNRFFVIYSLTLRDPVADATIFDSNTDDTLSRLVAVQDRSLDVKIPLQSLGLPGKISPGLRLQEANSFAKILPYQVTIFLP